MKTKSVLFLLFLFCSCSAQQNLQQTSNRNKSEEILGNKFRDNDNSLIFSISSKWYLVIIKNQNEYKEYFVKADSNNNVEVKLVDSKKNLDVLNKVFNINNYPVNFVNFNSEEHQKDNKSAQGNLTYFLLKDGKNVREFESSVVVDPSPIDKEIYYYLVTKLLKEISN